MRARRETVLQEAQLLEQREQSARDEDIQRQLSEIDDMLAQGALQHCTCRHFV